MSETIKNNMYENKELNIYQNNDNESTINNEINLFKRNVLLPNIKKSKLKNKALRILKEIDKKKENNSIFITEELHSDNGSKTVRVRKKKKIFNKIL